MQKPQYIHLSAALPDKELADSVIAILGEAGFTTFEESEAGVSAYIAENEYDAALTAELMQLYFATNPISYTTEVIASENWNEEWEKNYPNLYIDHFCQVLPSFRTPLEGFAHTIIIDPKMSFGTGHHATTQMMMLNLKELKPKGTKVIDMGCGTAILAILAEQLGAKEILGIDNDPWCVENAGENLVLNHCQKTSLLLGGAEAIPTEAKYDIFLANINRNILMQDGASYVAHIPFDGYLVISGFYEEDMLPLTLFFEDLAMTRIGRKEQNNWASLVFKKMEKDLL